MNTEPASPEEAARGLREHHPLSAERVQRIAALLLSVGATKEVA